MAKRFGIRNYGPSRQVAYEGQQICLSRDQYIETDDAELAAAMEAANAGEDVKTIHVTDRGVEAAAFVPPKERVKKGRKVTVDDAEAVHDEKFPDDDAQQQTQKDELREDESQDSKADADEIAYADMSYKELQVLAKDRQIKYTGVKKEKLIQDLEAYDRAE